jgi:hypothetical protein
MRPSAELESLVVIDSLYRIFFWCKIDGNEYVEAKLHRRGMWNEQ